MIQVRKLERHDFARFIDKVQVKKFVGDRIGREHLIPTLYAGERLPPLKERTWPLPFVIKANHGSGFNLFVRSEPDWPRIEEQLEKMLAFDYSRAAGETSYSAVKRQVLIEPLLGTGELPVDYKFLTFAGVPDAIQVDIDREYAHKRSYYDCAWNLLDIRCKYPLIEGLVPRPRYLDKMLEIASELGRDFPFVRVDLYEIGDRVYFGELTFTPVAGFQRITPRRIEQRWGALWRKAKDQMSERDCDRPSATEELTGQTKS